MVTKAAQARQKANVEWTLADQECGDRKAARLRKRGHRKQAGGRRERGMISSDEIGCSCLLIMMAGPPANLV